MSKLTPGNLIEDHSQLGRRDAFHVPAILVEGGINISPGDKVVFSDKSFTKVELAEEGCQYHGVVDPFLPEDFIDYGLFWVFLRPGISQQLVHHFEVILPDKSDLEEELEQRKREDPECAECYYIEDGQVRRA